MNKIPLFSILVVALPLLAGRAQSPKPLTEGDLFTNTDAINGDLLNPKPLTLLDGKPPAAKEKAANQTEVTADNVEFNPKTHIAIFTGEVFVVNPDFNLNCDKLTVYLKHDEKPAAAAADAKAKPAADAVPAVKSKGGLEKAIAEMTNGGKVIITQEKKEADGTISRSIGKAERTEYNAMTGEMVLIGWPEVTQGFNSSKATEEGTRMIMKREGTMRTIGRSKVIIQDNSSEKPAKQ